MAALCLPFILIALVKDLSILAWFSSVANVAGVISIGLIITDIISVSLETFDTFLVFIYTRNTKLQKSRAQVAQC